ncbi:hypothetical protein [Nocardioides bizhenqiangii]|uniref:GH16 domain-containing protein n=1 Tax=Nocardioides bizhenqiangii TaxID=3095076 RepID=A0ABZ0ZNP5_9ACTN|nr:hypothetical protein [Nocardioides sp. HM61]WQQ25581.1 hypothetical protein SHK19_16640 [Nocardioides sp. HM61]
MSRTGFTLRLATLATALVVGPATLAPGTAEAPLTSARAGDGPSAAQRYGWRTMQWDFAWEFGESLSDGPYRGANIRGGRWIDQSTGTGRAVKYGGGIEFHSGEVIRNTVTPDFGTTTLTLEGKPARLGRWELRERVRMYNQPQFGDAPGGSPYAFVLELIPADPAAYDCGRHNITIARAPVGGTSVQIGANAGTTRWSKTLTGYRRGATEGRLYAVQVTGRKISWFINGRVVASLGAAAAIPKIPMTVRMRMVGAGAKEMRKSCVLVDWLRNYDLAKGVRHPRAPGLNKGSFGGDC